MQAKINRLVLVVAILLYANVVLAQYLVYNKLGQVFVRELPSNQSRVVDSLANFSFISIYDAECGYDYDRSEVHKKYLRDCKQYADSCNSWFYTEEGYISMEDVLSVGYDTKPLTEEYISDYISEFRKDSCIIRVTKVPFDFTKHTVDTIKREIDGNYPIGGFYSTPEYEFKEIEVICSGISQKVSYSNLFNSYAMVSAGNLNDLYITIGVGDGAGMFWITWVFVNGKLEDYTNQTSC